MRTLRMIHTADLHVGSSFSLYPEQQDTLKREQTELLVRLAELCHKQAIDLLLIAGDFFDSHQPSNQLIRETTEIFASMCPARVVIAPGNHDPAFPDSPWLTVNWPENVNVFTGDADYFYFPDLYTYIYGAAFRSMASDKPLFKVDEIKLSQDPHAYRLLLLHGDITGREQKSPYNPIRRDWLRENQFDYIALGHIHQHSLPRKEPGSGAWHAYAGCPAGRGFDEADQKGVFLIELSKHAHTADDQVRRLSCDFDFLNIAVRVFWNLTVDISSCQSQQELYEHIMNQVSHSSPSWELDAFNITLSGTRQKEFIPGLTLLLSKLRSQLFICRLSDTSSEAVDIAALIQEHSLAGAFVRQIAGHKPVSWQSLTRQQQKVIELGLQAFHQEVNIHDPS